MRPALILMLAVGCGAHAERTDTARPTAYLVILAEGTELRTEWRDEDGTLRGRADGAVLGIGDRLYRFESRSEHVALRTCGEIVEDPETGTAREPRGTVASALLAGIGVESLVLIGPASDGAIQERTSYDESHRVLAALGDRIVVVSRRSGDACGAHGDLNVTVRTFDLATGEEVLEVRDDRDPLRARGPEALAAMRAIDPDRTAGCLPADRVSAERRATVPTFSSTGLGARHLFSVPVPQACGTLDAPTSAYEWGIWLEGPEPELPAAYEERVVPRGVLERAGGAVGVTWLFTDRAAMGDAFALASE
jgi:hypothetical protein